jgi:hypothetical protein
MQYGPWLVSPPRDRHDPCRASRQNLFYRRLPPDDSAVTITGDHTLIHHWLAHTAF